MQIEQKRIPLRSLEPNRGQVKWLPKNPRQWTQEQLDRLKASIEETPQLLEARGLIVYPHKKDAYIVIGGNMRLAALKEMGVDEAPCLVLPADTTPEKVKEIALKDNGNFGQWDARLLMEEWGDFPMEDFNMTQWKPSSQQTSEGAGAGDEGGLPEELDGVDINPDKMEELIGDDETEKERIIITFKESERGKVAELFGIDDITSKVVWWFDEILKKREAE